MYSFYGGRPGNSFIIITTYRSIADMVTNFKKGPDYTAVHYDEHVMINTVNKNDPDNGRVYRRGYDFTNDLGGAEYIGTIVGPAGKAPMLEMTTVADVKSKHASEGYDERFTSGEYAVAGGNLVPGKTAGGFNDTITWACCSIRNENDEDTTAYIGFTFPYLVVDWETSWIQPYAGGAYADTSSATRVDDEAHPFYAKWHINVPKGVKGDALKNFKVEAATVDIQPYEGQSDDVNNSRMILAYDYYNYDEYQDGAPVRLYLGDYNMIDNVSIDDEGTITIDYSHDDDSVFTKKIKWVKSVTLNTETGLFTVIYNHTTDASGNNTTYTTYLDWIDEVNIADDGTITFGHTHEPDTVFDKKIQWCTGVTINTDGTFTFAWNNGTEDTVFKNIAQWIKSVDLTSDGTLVIGYNNGAESSVFERAIKWISNIRIADDGTILIEYNNSEPVSYPNKIKWIDDITMTDDGTLSIAYNNGEDPAVFSKRIKWISSADIDSTGSLILNWNNGDPSTVILHVLKWISEVYLNQFGTLQFRWNNDEIISFDNIIKWISGITVNQDGLLTITFNNGTPDFTAQLNYLKDVSVNTVDSTEIEGTGNQKICVTWTDGTKVDIGNPINYVMQMGVNNQNHLLVRYSDPERRTSEIIFNGKAGWTDLGIITHEYEYSTGSQVTNQAWIGVGQIFDYGAGNKEIKFFVSLTALLASEVTEAQINNGFLNGKSATDTITQLDLTGVTAEKQLTGLQFIVDSGIPSSGVASTDWINLSIENLEMHFS